MSFQAMAVAIKATLPTYEKFLLLTLANYANDVGDSWPSVATLVRDTSMSRDTVMRNLLSLESRGMLTITHRVVEGVNLPNVYRLNLLEMATVGVVADSYYPSPTAKGVVADSNTNLSMNLSKRRRESAGARKPSVLFDYQTGNFSGITDDWVADMQRRFPEVAVSREIERAGGWLIANRDRPKTRIAAFLTNWMLRAADRIAAEAAAAKANPRAARPATHAQARQQERADTMASFFDTPPPKDSRDVNAIDVPFTEH